MEIEPELMPDDSGDRQHDPFATPALKPWQAVVATVVGLAVLGVILFFAFWLAVILIGIGLIAWLIRTVKSWITGEPVNRSSGVRIVVRRPPGD